MERKYALGKVQVTGVSKIVREADENGMVVLERNGQRVALVVPLSPSGFGRFVKRLLAVVAGGRGIDTDFQLYLRFLIASVRTDLGRLLDLTGESTSDVPEVKKRREPRH